MPIPSHSPRRRSSSPGAVRRLVLGLAFLLWTGWAPAASAQRWVRPVPGKVARPFKLGADPFAGGQHRGVDLVAHAGTRVRSACSGVVTFAGVVPGMGRVASVRCGRWRVSYLPLATAFVRRGSVVAGQSRLGTVDTGHGGLHVGVRREGQRFGYIDPLSRFGADPPPPVAVRIPRIGPSPRPQPSRPSPMLRPVSVPAPQARPEPALAPWPAWLGLGLLLTGATGGAGFARRRARRPLRAVVTVPRAR